MHVNIVIGNKLDYKLLVLTKLCYEVTARNSLTNFLVRSNRYNISYIKVVFNQLLIHVLIQLLPKSFFFKSDIKTAFKTMFAGQACLYSVHIFVISAKMLLYANGMYMLLPPGYLDAV